MLSIFRRESLFQFARCCLVAAMRVGLWVTLLVLLPALTCADDDAGESFDPMQRNPNMPPDYVPDVFATAETNHLQYYQDADGNEWKWETTQNLQREFMTTLFNISSTLHAHPDAVKSYEDLREHLDTHCNRVYNGERQVPILSYSSMLPVLEPMPARKLRASHFCASHMLHSDIGRYL